MKPNQLLRPLATAILVIGGCLLSAGVWAQMTRPEDAPTAAPTSTDKYSTKMGLEPRLGNTMPKDVELTNERGEKVKFGSFLGGKPVLFLPIFYKCNGVCEQEVYGLVKTLAKDTALRPDQAPDKVIPGRDAKVIVVSIHPKETPALAAAERVKIMNIFQMGWDKLPQDQQGPIQKTVNEGFEFLVGSETEVKKLTDAIGFRYTFDEKLDWVFHPSALVFLTPTGKVSSYITGVNYASKLVRANVTRAQKDEVGPLGETYLLGCVMLDPKTGRTTLVVKQILMYACILTVIAIALSIYHMNKNDKNKLPGGGAVA